MKNMLRALFTLLVLFALPGCAGGWRGGVAPGQWGDAAPVATASASAPVKAKGDGKSTQATAEGVQFVFAGEASSVNVAGEFNSWSTSADPLKKQANGTWTLVKPLAAGKYAYKFVVNGTDWKPDDNAPETADDGYGGKNSVVVVGTGASGAAQSAVPAAKPAAAAAAPAASADGVTFRYSGPGGTVHLAGEFNSWSTSADPLKKQADGSWSITKAIPAGKYPYKFVIDGTTWKEDAGAAEFVDDGYGGKNSVVVVAGAGASGAAQSAVPAVTSAAAAAPAAGGDGATFRYSGPGGTVNVAGEFNSWSTSADPMKKQADGSWTLTKQLPAGKYAYKFVVDGTNWKEDPAAKETVDDGYGGKNAVMVVGGGGAAAAPAAKPAAASAAKPLAAGVKPKAPSVTAAGVAFTYAGAAKSSVALCGDFNNWAPLLNKMTQQADGCWTVTVKLPAGKHAYKFLVDGSNWKQDDGNPASADDGLGGKNSVVVVK